MSRTIYISLDDETREVRLMDATRGNHNLPPHCKHCSGKPMSALLDIIQYGWLCDLVITAFVCASCTQMIAVKYDVEHDPINPLKR